MMSTSDPQHLPDLLADATTGDTSAQARLFEHFSGPVYRLCLGLLGDVEDAEEVLQDSFVYAFRNLDRYDPAQAGFQTWLFVIATSRARNKRRRKWLAQVPLAAVGEVRNSDSSRPVEASLAARGVRRELWQALQTLPDRQREALVLRFFGGMPYKEIGDLLHCKPKTAESRVRLALKALRAVLAPEHVDAELNWADDPAI